MGIRVCHLATADLWAGAEVQLAILLQSLCEVPDLEVSAVLFNDGRLAKELVRIGVDTEVIPESRYNALSLSRRLTRYFEQHAVDVLHTHKCKDNVIGALASAGRAVRRVRTVHGSTEPFRGFDALKMHIYEGLDRVVNRWAVDRVLAVSFDLAARLAERLGPDKVKSVHNGIDLGRLRISERSSELRNEVGLSAGHVVVGTMCRLVPVKGLESFVRAARLIRDRRPDARFVIAGDGPSRDALRALAHEYGLADMRFLGHRDDGHDVLGMMDVFVLPSLSEGIPIVLLEAMARSRPVVASRVGGIPEVIEHGSSGLLVEPGRHEELATSCLALLEDYQTAKRLGAAGRKRVEERFSADAMARSVADVYRTLMWSENANEDWTGRLRSDRAGARTFHSVAEEAPHRRRL